MVRITRDPIAGAGTPQNNVRQVRQARAQGLDAPGQAVQQAGQAISAFAGQMQKIKDTNELASAELRMNEDLDRRFRDVTENGDFDPAEYETRFQQSAKELRAELEGGFSNKQVAKLFGQRFDERTQGYTFKTRDATRRKTLDMARADLLQNVATVSDAFANASDASVIDTNANTLLEQITLQEQQGLLDASTAEQQRQRTTQAAEAAQFGLVAKSVSDLVNQGDIQGARERFAESRDDMTTARADQLSGMLEDAAYGKYGLMIMQGEMDRAAVEALEGQPGMTDGRMAGLLQKIGTKENQDRIARDRAEAEYQGRNYAELQVGMHNGSVTKADVQMAYEQGRIADNQWSNLMRQEGEKKKVDESLLFVSELYANGLPPNPYDSRTQKGTDAMFEAQGGIGLFAQDFDQAMALTGTYADFGVIPSQAVDAISGMIYSGATPAQQTKGLQSLAALRDQAPNAVNAEFTDRQISEAVSFQTLRDAGVPADRALLAIEAEREARDDPNGPTAALQAEARKNSSKLELKQVLKRSNIEGAQGVLGTPFFKPDSQKVGSRASAGDVQDQLVAAQAVETGRELYEMYYGAHGDDKRARRQMQAHMETLVGTTAVNGGSAMFHPPENYYSVPGEDGDWMRDAVEDMLSFRDGSTEDFRLISDARTQDDIDAGLPPTYGLQLIDSNGVSTFTRERVGFQEEMMERRQKAAEDKGHNVRDKTLRAADRAERQRQMGPYGYSTMSQAEIDTVRARDGERE